MTQPKPWKPGPYQAGALVTYEGMICRRNDFAYDSSRQNEWAPPASGFWQPLGAASHVEAMRHAADALQAWIDSTPECGDFYDQQALEALRACLLPFAGGATGEETTP